MRSLLTLSLAFALLVTYLEFMVNPATASIQQPSESAKIIRQPAESITKPKTQPEIKISSTVKASHPPRPTLNLQLPFSDNTLHTQHLVFAQKTPLTRLFQRSKETISYNAELVFDAERGESITGGKVNIKIPFG